MSSSGGVRALLDSFVSKFGSSKKEKKAKDKAGWDGSALRTGSVDTAPSGTSLHPPPALSLVQSVGTSTLSTEQYGPFDGPRLALFERTAAASDSLTTAALSSFTATPTQPPSRTPPPALAASPATASPFAAAAAADRQPPSILDSTPAGLDVGAISFDDLGGGQMWESGGAESRGRGAESPSGGRPVRPTPTRAPPGVPRLNLKVVSSMDALLQAAKAPPASDMQPTRSGELLTAEGSELLHYANSHRAEAQHTYRSGCTTARRPANALPAPPPPLSSPAASAQMNLLSPGSHYAPAPGDAAAAADSRLGDKKKLRSPSFNTVPAAASTRPPAPWELDPAVDRAERPSRLTAEALSHHPEPDSWQPEGWQPQAVHAWLAHADLEAAPPTPDAMSDVLSDSPTPSSTTASDCQSLLERHLQLVASSPFMSLPLPQPSPMGPSFDMVRQQQQQQQQQQQAAAAAAAAADSAAAAGISGRLPAPAVPRLPLHALSQAYASNVSFLGSGTSPTSTGAVDLAQPGPAPSIPPPQAALPPSPPPAASPLAPLCPAPALRPASPRKPLTLTAAWHLDDAGSSLTAPLPSATLAVRLPNNHGGAQQPTSASNLNFIHVPAAIRGLSGSGGNGAAKDTTLHKSRILEDLGPTSNVSNASSQHSQAPVHPQGPGMPARMMAASGPTSSGGNAQPDGAAPEGANGKRDGEASRWDASLVVSPSSLRLPTAAPAGKTKAIAVATHCPEEMCSPQWHVEDFSLLRKLYEGNLSVVCQAQHRRSGRHCALKIYKRSRLHEMERFQLAREICLHIRVLHPYVVSLYAAWKDAKYVYLALEWAPAGSLFDYLVSRGGRLSEADAAAVVMRPLLTALAYLHSQQFIHRDIKLENIVMDASYNIKLADFGLAIDQKFEQANTRLGTFGYFAPEVLDCPLKKGPFDFKDQGLPGYSSKVDVWSAGVVAYELLVGKAPFSAASAAKIIEAIRHRQLEYPDNLSAEAKDFLGSALQRDPLIRPTARQLLQHPWLVQQAAAVAASRLLGGPSSAHSGMSRGGAGSSGGAGRA